MGLLLNPLFSPEKENQAFYSAKACHQNYFKNKTKTKNCTYILLKNKTKHKKQKTETKRKQKQTGMRNRALLWLNHAVLEEGEKADIKWMTGLSLFIVGSLSTYARFPWLQNNRRWAEKAHCLGYMLLVSVSGNRSSACKRHITLATRCRLWQRTV